MHFTFYGLAIHYIAYRLICAAPDATISATGTAALLRNASINPSSSTAKHAELEVHITQHSDSFRKYGASFLDTSFCRCGNEWLHPFVRQQIHQYQSSLSSNSPVFSASAMRCPTALSSRMLRCSSSPGVFLADSAPAAA